MPDEPRFDELKKELLADDSHQTSKAIFDMMPAYVDGEGNSRHFDRSGNSITLAEWSTLFQCNEYKIVKQEPINDEVNVSTVWLGLNHSFIPTVKMIFETLVFGLGDGLEQMHRYGTIEEAQVGHRVVVSMLHDQLTPVANIATPSTASVVTEVKAELTKKLREFDLSD